VPPRLGELVDRRACAPSASALGASTLQALTALIEATATRAIRCSAFSVYRRRLLATLASPSDPISAHPTGELAIRRPVALWLQIFPKQRRRLDVPERRTQTFAAGRQASMARAWYCGGRLDLCSCLAQRGRPALPAQDGPAAALGIALFAAGRAELRGCWHKAAAVGAAAACAARGSATAPSQGR
jgi:hypothetical protein